ncbi:hypothetical protein A1O1_06724 [Capronia coronata CBS 617.96]|uniref:DUF2415 domain-containing protein n=1 Tax=Capronia coronata CBS 617.96 TaxID=1182541 RepID=W9Y1I1_9EURO|nr:uncharacterized protein A1O1_06724 [Capronia coronata CBS 617.96]EXJ83106.1 hypothetical protein A1O1_06724 [Capronia coronata CBS 617.96]
MTVSDREICLTPTNGLATPHKFYPTKISVPHHQLRHFISTSEANLIYYVTGYDVFVLDLETHENSLLATIPFEARCLAADLGWVCVGGEVNGDCAFIKVEKDQHGHPTCFGHDLLVDLLGGEIVNSMNVYNMVNEGNGPDELIVLISNNDKTVKLYSLAQRQVLTTLSHPVPMNFAAMSPDCKFIAAVGDSDKVYFYRRRLDDASDPIDGPSTRYAKYEWEIFAEPVVPTGDHVYDDYSFAVAFSPSGHMCAASSQGGAISVFDMRQLVDSDEAPEKSILCTFKSSRRTLWGCVRAMAFSPAPWDILAWAEDHGRIGLADMRRAFVRRQILDLDRKQMDTVKLGDGTPVAYRSLGVKERLKQQHLARLRAMRALSSRGEDDEVGIDDPPTDASRRPARQDLLSYHQGLDLDARERSVIEALETTMDSVAHVPTRPYSINYSSPPRIRDSLASTDSRREYEVQLLNPGARRLTTFQTHQPRRRTSVVLSEPTLTDGNTNQGGYLDPTDGTRIRLSASPGRIDDEEHVPSRPVHGLGSRTTPAGNSGARRASSRIPTSDPWHVIQTALESARESDNSNQVNLMYIETVLEAERQLANQIESRLADERRLSILLQGQIDAQQRLLGEHSVQLDHWRAAASQWNGRVEATLERVLQRQLTDEQRFSQQRSQELQGELSAGMYYSRRLERERARLGGRDAGATSTSTRSATTPSTESASAQTSALPTTNVLASADSDNLSHILTDYRESSRQRLAHVENLERQVRRAEARVAQATTDIEALEGIVRTRGVWGSEESDNRRNDDATHPGTASTASTSATDATTRPVSTQPESPRVTTRRVGVPMNRPHLATIDRLSELAGRVPEADMRLARMMFLSGMSGNRALDANGNWLPGSGLHRVLAGASSLAALNGSSGESDATVAAADVVREMGPGTAGIGFSPDGQYL